MTFHEAGLQILERAGQPLSSQEITTRAIQEGLLSHVGQIPEQTMRERLAALARRSRNRRVVVVGPDRFALTDWGLVEDSDALSKLDAPLIPDEGPPRRSRERHPPTLQPRGGRSEGKDAHGRHRRKRLPPLAEVAVEILGESHRALTPDEILARARERELVSDDLSPETLGTAIAEENRRRVEAGRRPAFKLTAGGAVELMEGTVEAVEERHGAPQREPQQALESRRNAARQLRRRLAELDAGGLERVAEILLERSGYRDVRTVRSAGSGEGPLLVARRKLGLCDYRFAVRLAPGGAELGREDVQQLRRDLAAQGAHAGLVIGPAEAGRDAKSEAQLPGQPLVTLLCAEALADELVLRQVGTVVIEISQVDEGFWRSMRRSQPRAPAPPPEAPTPPPKAALPVPPIEAALPESEPAGPAPSEAPAAAPEAAEGTPAQGAGEPA